MFAPQVMYYKECLSGNHGLNGTAVESDKAIKLLDKLFEILDPIEPMGTDDNKRIWIWADRGSADDSWDYEDMLLYGDVKDREDFEKQFTELYPCDTYWFPLRIMRFPGFQAVFLMYDCIFERDTREHSYQESSKTWNNEDYDMLEFLIEAAERSFHMIEAGTYNDFIQENLPLRYRTGAIPSKVFHEVYPVSLENLLDGLTPEEIREFQAVVESGECDNKAIGRMEKMTSGIYFEVVGKCYEAIGGRFLSYGCSPKEKYHRVTFSYGDSLVALDEFDAESFERWYGEWHDPHLWEIIPGRTYTRVMLYVQHDEKGWYFYVSGCHRLMETIRIFLTVRKLGYPVSIYEPEHLLDACLEKDRILIVPTGIIPYGDERLSTGEYMMWTINLADADMQNAQLMDSIEWFPLEFPVLKRVLASGSDF